MIKIKYTQRLGDIVRMLPLALHYAELGEEVQILCNDQYHEIFQHVPYCKPVSAQTQGDWEGITHNPEIWPARFSEYRASGMPWLQFVYNLYPAVDVSPLFCTLTDKRLFQPTEAARKTFLDSYGTNYKIAFPTQWSEQSDPNVVLSKCPFAPDLIAVPPEIIAPNDPRVVTFRQADLPFWIEYAQEIYTCNSAPSIIAGAVRKKPYYHLCGPLEQDDWKAPNQIRI